MIATLLRGFEIRSIFSINLFCYLFIFSAFVWSLVVGSRRESGTSVNVRVSWLSSDYGNRRCEFRFPQRVNAQLSISKEGREEKYLGLPEHFGRKKKDFFASIVNRMKQKALGWSTKFSPPHENLQCYNPSTRLSPPLSCHVSSYLSVYAIRYNQFWFNFGGTTKKGDRKICRSQGQTYKTQKLVRTLWHPRSGLSISWLDQPCKNQTRTCTADHS